MIWDFSKLSFNAENFSFLIFGTLACALMLVYAYACTKHAHAELKNAHVEFEHSCAYACMCVHALGFPWSLFSNKKVFLIKKRVIFFQKHFLKSISIRLGLKPTSGFRIPTSLWNGGLSH